MTDLNMNFTMSEEELQERIAAINVEVDEVELGMEEQRRNRIRCGKCNEIIESTFRHDFKGCGCGAVYVDGGNDYCRMGGNFEDIILMYNDGSEKPLQVAHQEDTEAQLAACDKVLDDYEDAIDDAAVFIKEQETSTTPQRLDKLEESVASITAQLTRILMVLENNRDDGK